MKNTIKALSKQFFGAKYESARKSLLAAAILFILTLVLRFYFTFGTPSGVLTPAAVQESFLTEIFYDNNPLSHFLNVG